MVHQGSRGRTWGLPVHPPPLLLTLTVSTDTHAHTHNTHTQYRHTHTHTHTRRCRAGARLVLWNGVDCSSLLMSRSRRIPRRSCRTIPRGDKLDGLLGTKTCLCCTTAPATVRWESLLATQGQLPACSRQLRSPAPATVRWGGDVLWCTNV